MKTIHLLLILFVISSCSQYKGIFVFEEKQYWNENDAGDQQQFATK